MGGHDYCDGYSVLVDGEAWAAGLESHRLEGHSREHSEVYTDSKEWMALVHASLAAIEQPSVDVLVAGLPVSEYFSAHMKAKVRARLEGVHQVRAGVQVEVKRAVVVAQPIGAFTDYVRALTASGGRPLSSDHMTLVIDPGHYSVDWVVFQGIKSLRRQSSSSSNQAGRSILVNTVRLIYQTCEKRIATDQLEAAVRRGDTTMRVGKDEIDLTPFLDQAGANIVDQVLKDVSASIGNDKHALNTVILTGGGSGLFKPAVTKKLGHAEIVVGPEPILGNARGFWSIGQGAP